MALSCSYIPHNKKGEELKGFQTYRRELEYETAAKVFTIALSPSFQKQYKKDLVLDNQGVPTYESITKIPYIKKFIGTDRLMKADQKKFPKVENTRENYQRQILAAHSYNQNSDNRDLLTAVVAQTSDGMLQVEIRQNIRSKSGKSE